MRDKYVLDSSIWISIERKDKNVIKIIEPLIKKNEVCLVDVIEAEVLRGAMTISDYRKLSQAFSFFTKLSTGWDRVAELAFKIAKKGFMPPLIDVYIANAVIENGKTLISHDKHFSYIQKVSPLKLMLVR